MRLAALLLALPAVAIAQSEPEPLPRYNVEVIVFAHSDVDPAEEMFAHEDAEPEVSADSVRNPRDLLAIAPIGPRLPLPGDADTAAAPLTDGLPVSGPAANEQPADDAGPGAADPPAPGADPQAPDATPATAPNDPLEYIDPFGRSVGRPADPADPAEAVEPPPFRVLRPDELELGDARQIIDRLGAYRLLGHGGWQQYGLDEREAMPVDLARLGIPNPTGTIELYLGRFLHVRFDLDYRDGMSVPVLPQRPETGVPGSFEFGDSSLLAPIDLPRRYALDTERNAIRSGELHYVDHPRFGVLLRVTPAPEEPEDAQPAGDGEQPSA